MSDKFVQAKGPLHRLTPLLRRLILGGRFVPVDPPPGIEVFIELKVEHHSPTPAGNTLSCVLMAAYCKHAWTSSRVKVG